MWDVTIIDTLAQSYVAATSQLAGPAADATEARKQRKYEALQNRFVVQPVGFETMGSRGARARSFLTDIGGRVMQVTGNQRAMEFLRQRVSIEIQRGNAAAVMGTVENSKDCNNLFLLPSVLFVVVVVFQAFSIHGLFTAVGQGREFVFPQFSERF